MTEVTIRDAGVDDLPALHRLWRRADGDPVDDGSTDVLPLHRHLLREGTVLVAEAGGSPVGFGAVTEHDGVVLLSDLFVVRQGRGIGRELLHALFARHPSPRRCTAASSDVRAVPLYRSFGMVERGALLHLEWTPDRHEVQRVVAAASRPTTTSGPVDERVHAQLNLWFGRDRSTDVRYWSSLGASAVTIAGGHGDPIGAGLFCATTPWVPSGSGTRLGPIVSAAGPDAAVAAVAAVHGTLAAALEHPAREPSVRLVIGEPHPAVPWLRELGFVEVDRDVYMSSDAEICDLRRHVGAADLW